MSHSWNSRQISESKRLTSEQGTPWSGTGGLVGTVIFYSSTQVVAAICAHRGKIAFCRRLGMCKPHHLSLTPEVVKWGSPENSGVAPCPWQPSASPHPGCSGGPGAQTTGRDLPHLTRPLVLSQPWPLGEGCPRPAALLCGQGQHGRPSFPGRGATGPSPPTALAQCWPTEHTQPSARPQARHRLAGCVCGDISSAAAGVPSAAPFCKGTQEAAARSTRGRDYKRNESARCLPALGAEGVQPSTHGGGQGPPGAGPPMPRTRPHHRHLIMEHALLWLLRVF